MSRKQGGKAPADREVIGVFTVLSVADDTADTAKRRGRNGLVHPAYVHAEGLAELVYVVVADKVPS